MGTAPMMAVFLVILMWCPFIGGWGMAASVNLHPVLTLRRKLSLKVTMFYGE